MRIKTAAVIVGAAMATACSDTNSPTQPRIDPPAAAIEEPGDAGLEVFPGNAKFHPTVQEAAARASTPGILAGPPILYHSGGPVIATPKVVAIYWSNNKIYTNGPTPGTTGVGTSDASLVGYFLRNMGGTPFWGINHQYTDNIGAGHVVANSLQYTNYWANNVNVPSSGSSVSDASIRSMITSGLNSGKLPISSSVTYAVFSGPGVNLGGGFGTQYCAYHSWFTYFFFPTTITIKYAVMPRNADFVGACTAVNSPGHSPNADFPADAEVNTLSHELEEAATDPKLNAWYDAFGAENADKCAWTWGTLLSGPNGSKYNVTFGGKHFLIQRNWKIGPNPSNQTGCALF